MAEFDGRKIMKTYKQFITEMALDIGDANKIYNDATTRKNAYNKSKDYNATDYNTGNKHVTVHKKVGRIDGKPGVIYHTNDNKKGESLHSSTIVTHPPTKKLPFHHDEQLSINRKSGDELPKGYGTDFTYNHFKKSEHPLRSSDMQMSGGHEMWKKLAHKALDDGHHVYYHDSENLHKSTKENVDTHLKNYFGWTNAKDKADYGNRHMILSKKEL